MIAMRVMVVTCFVGLPLNAFGQEAGGIIGTWAGIESAPAAPASSTPSPRERRFALQLASRLKRAAISTERVRYSKRWVGAGERLPAAVGTKVTLKGGLVVERLAFPNSKEAKRYALYAAGQGQRPLLIEARGRQVVVLQGQPLENARFMSRARRAAWRGLNAPKGAPEVLGAFLGESDSILALEQTEPNFEQRFAAALSEARSQDQDGVTRVGPNHFLVRQPEIHAEIEADGETRKLWVTRNPDRAAFLKRYQHVLEQESQRLKRTEPRKARRHQRDGGRSGGYLQMGILPKGAKLDFAGLLGSAGHFGQTNTGGFMGIQASGSPMGLTVTPGEVEAEQRAQTRHVSRGTLGGVDDLFN